MRGDTVVCVWGGGQYEGALYCVRGMLCERGTSLCEVSLCCARGLLCCVRGHSIERGATMGHYVA